MKYYLTVLLAILLFSCKNSVKRDKVNNDVICEGNKNLLSIPIISTWKYGDNGIKGIEKELDYYDSYERNFSELLFSVSSENTVGYDSLFNNYSTGRILAYQDPKVIKKFQTSWCDIYIIRDSLLPQYDPKIEVPVYLHRIDLVQRVNKRNISQLNILYNHEGAYAALSKYFYICQDTIHLKTFRTDEEKIQALGYQKWLITKSGFRKIE